MARATTKTEETKEKKTPSKAKLRSFSYPGIGGAGTVIRAKDRAEADQKAKKLMQDMGETPEEGDQANV